MEPKQTVIPRRIRKLWIFSTLLAVIIFLFLFFPRFLIGPYTQYSNLTQNDINKPIPFVALTNETNNPFLAGDKKSVLKFPDTRSCLIRAEAKKERPDLRLINWHKFWSLEEAEVCIWRIFTSLGTPQRAEEWLKFHNPRAVYLRKLNPENVESISSYKIEYVLNAMWKKRRRSMPYVRKGLPTDDEFWSPELGLGARWDDNGRLRYLDVLWVQSF